MQLVIRDSNQGPFLSRVLSYGQQQAQLSTAELTQLKTKAVLMSLKFADKFYNKYKMHLLEQAAHDVIGVVSLGLTELADHDLAKALQILRSSDGIMKPFQKGWSMLVTVSQSQPQRKRSLYGDVDEWLLQQIASPPDSDEWQGWSCYQQALTEHHRRSAIQVLKQQFFYQTAVDHLDLFNLEAVLAEAVLYRALCSGAKVRQDLKQRLRSITLQEHWFATTYFELQTEAALAELPSAIASAVRADLSPQFCASLAQTMQFIRGYQRLLLEQATPEKLDAFEGKQGLLNPLLGWPQYIDM